MNNPIKRWSGRLMYACWGGAGVAASYADWTTALGLFCIGVAFAAYVVWWEV